MSFHTATKGSWFTTSKELRQIADKMEERMPFLTCGDSCTMHKVNNQYHSLDIIADQGEHSKYKQNMEGQNWL